MIYYFLPFIILIGLFTSYQDIKTNKIKNILIVYSIITSIILNTTIFIKDFNTQYNNQYYSQFLINLIITVIICIVLWLFKFWPAGDAKLIIAYTSLIPITIYSLDNIKYLPSFSLFVNIFVPYTLFFVFYSFFFKKTNHIFILKSLNYKQLLITIFSIFVIMWPIDYLSYQIPFLNSFVTKIILIISLFSLLNLVSTKLFKDSIIPYFLLALLRLIIQFNKISNFNFIKIFMIYCILFLFLKYFIMDVTQHETRKTLPFAPFAFFGVVLTIISKGMFINLIIYLLNLMS